MFLLSVLKIEGQIEGLTGTDAIMVWRRNVRSRICLEFTLFKAMNDIGSFLVPKNTLCAVLNEKKKIQMF